MSTIIRRLHPGDAFRIDLGPYGHVDYRLIHWNECRAYVEPLHRKKDILDDSPGGRASISPNCECDKIDEELEQIMNFPKPIAHAKTSSEPAKKKGAVPAKAADRKFDPKKQERPVRGGTIRARLLAALESGKTDVQKLMKEFNMARSLFVAHVHELWNCHGYGYSITGDVVKLVKPLGGAMKTTEPKAKSAKSKAKAKPAARDPLDDEDEDPLA